MSNDQQAGFTPPSGHYPPYVNMRRAEACIEITVRSASPDGGVTCGVAASIRLSDDDFKALVGDALARIFGP